MAEVVHSCDADAREPEWDQPQQQLQSSPCLAAEVVEKVPQACPPSAWEVNHDQVEVLPEVHSASCPQPARWPSDPWEVLSG